jgi:hypothetical protein
MSSNSIFAFLATPLMDRALYWRTRTTPTNSGTLVAIFTLTRMRTGGSTQLTFTGENALYQKSDPGKTIQELVID